MNAISMGWMLRMSALLVALILLLSACGGGGTGKAESKGEALEASSSATASTPDSSFASGAALSSAELAAAEKAAVAADASGSATPLDELQPGQIAAKSAYTSGAVVRKAAAVRIPVYRFSNSRTGAHFFTTSTIERDHVIATMSPPYSHEGEAFQVASDFSPGLSPVHRFYNTRTGVHFYTISESERASVAANMPHFTYEGIAYYASQVAGQGLIPFYRFYVPGRGFHFYTANEAEKDSIIANLAATYSYEGVGYYVLDTNWTAQKLPHSGITDQQCYQAGSNTLVACSSSAVTDLNAQQDGRRVSVNPMSYSAVPIPSRGSLLLHPFTDCVRDNVTGLVWEGKTDDGGLRDKDNRYTNQGGGASTDTSGYVAAVNALNLCGYSDWRLPTRAELINLVDYGKTGFAPINATSFGNTAQARHWSADVMSNDSTMAWYVGWEGYGGSASYYPDSWSFAVRLVRGSALSGTRFSFSTIAYGSDAANNVVNDAWTGLQWRRCEEGRVWGGSTCSGSESLFTHEQALARARDQSGWRLPNIKELNSLTDLRVSSGTRIDATAFSGATGTVVWSSSPYVGNAFYAWVVDFGDGVVGGGHRNSSAAVRLVRASQ